ncbi:MAG: DUF1549 and DUF1553 domain-containing protein [Verrucomicrobiales bacterium]
MPLRTSVLIALLFPVAWLSADGTPLPLGEWLFGESGNVSTIHELRGTGRRQNPLRRRLHEPFDGDAIFVRFRMEYAAESLDSPPQDEGEFFVLWLDEDEGGEGSSHSQGIPNLGVHVKDAGENRFMVRFDSKSEAYGPLLAGDRKFLLVARLSKSRSGADQPFDRLALWVDPKPDEVDEPHAAIDTENSTVKRVRWMGFSTGAKTEPEDRIRVRDLALATRWKTIFSAAAPGSIPPPIEPLSEAEIPDPPAYEPPPPPADIAAVDPPPASIETDHWAFQTIARPPTPDVRNRDWVRSPVDAFVARKHEELGLSPAPAADPATLARRMALVVSGLPSAGLPPARLPSDSLKDPADFDAYADTLLASTAYGERWGRHWLDVARWAESDGHQHNGDRLHAWRYRDWVVDAFNDDKPFDAFVREQIAGDEIEPYSPDHLIATGFLAAARYSGNELDKDIQRNDILVDIVNTTSKAFLGLTMECAQCHDHFFDPVTQWDYYRMQAFFAQGQPGDVVLEPNREAENLIAKRWGLFESVRDRLVESKRKEGVPEPVMVIPKSVPKGMTKPEALTFQRIEKAIADLPQTWAYYSPVTSPHELAAAPNRARWPLPFQREALEQTRVRFLDRGEPSAPGPEAESAWPGVFGATPPDLGGRPRLAFADWLTDPDHPLVARVWVNRIWQGYFGRGLVESSGDFGTAGAEPSHPGLLDWLARELIDSGWSTKHVHRLILRSNTFRQSALFSAANADRDPSNETLWRWQPRRLEAEAVRDSLLAVAGMLDARSGGPSVPIAQTETSHRRSLYLQQKRDQLPHQQMLFDGAGAVTSCAKRQVSTTGLQPLWMLNSEFMQTLSATLAARIAEECDDPPAQADRLLRLAFHRSSEKEEIEQLARRIRDSSLEDAVAIVLNTNEFVYLP